ncbi:hypothetical protein [Chthoniobacter sp.]|uniref:hypothetical protein n=1 Tax=Chthoniobacter sp. TaxID=2510640 RepID=UPI0032AF660F
MIAGNSPDTLHYESLAFPGSEKTTFDVGKGVITKRYHGHDWDGHDPVVQRRRMPSEVEWKKFWQTMDSLHLWDWKASYYDPDMMDGHAWRMSCCIHSHRIKSDGSNAYPRLGHPQKTTSDNAAFSRLTSALEKLVDPGN